MTSWVTSLTAALLIAACTKENPSYCDSDTDCSGGLVCYVAGHSCVAPSDASPPVCFGADKYEACLTFTPTDPVTLDGTLDTVSSALCLATQPDGWTTRQPEACFVVGKTVTVNNVAVYGARPLVVLGETINIDGLLDAAAHQIMPTKVAPGAPYPNCAPFNGAPTSTQSAGAGAAGGAGGSFMTEGAVGGFGENGLNGNRAGVPALADAAPPGSLRGGCAGQNGGDSAAAAGGGGGGAGGAVYLAASDAINFGLNGIINASGGGAHASSQLSGGGGGGTGGMIVLYAKNTLNSGSARLLANGGGGSSGTTSGAGVAGQDPPSTMPLVQAAAVTGPQNCCKGNVGYAGGMDAYPGGNAGTGQSGGGGGGGGGFIQSNMAISSQQVSPPAVM